jgi:hypothetical protein
MLSNVVFSHDKDESKTGLWVKELLDVKHDNNWPIEPCFKLKEGQRLQYRFSAPFRISYDVHAHPSNTQEHKTLILEKPQQKLKSSGDLKASLPGIYCFNFVALEKLSYNWSINFQYRID